MKTWIVRWKIANAGKTNAYIQAQKFRETNQIHSVYLLQWGQLQMLMERKRPENVC